MNANEAKQARASGNIVQKRPAFWRSSLYAEPTWVSLAWIIGPGLLAGVAIYFAVR